MNKENVRITPMMAQYNKIKKNCKDAILLYRLGDFYEIFNDDAIAASKVLNIKLTKRSPKSNVLMCGMPHHSAERHIVELLKNGLNVAICEQVGDPNEGEIINREITQYLTPADLIEFTECGYDYFKVVSVYYKRNNYHTSTLNINTGDLTICRIEDIGELSLHIKEVSPIEVISNIDLSKLTKTKTTKLPAKYFSNTAIVDKYQLADSVLVENHQNCVIAANAILSYTGEKSSKRFNSIKKIRTITNDYLIIDNSSFSNLNLIDSEYSLFKLLNKTKTPSGARRLRESIKRPFNNFDSINKRHSFIECLTTDSMFKSELESMLVEIYDVERLISRVSSGNVSAQELLNLSKTIKTMLEISNIVDCKNEYSFSHFKFNRDIVSFMAEIIDNAISSDDEEANENIIIKRGYDPEIDKYINELNHYDDRLISYMNGIKGALINHNKKLSSVNVTNLISDGICIEVPQRLVNDFNEFVFEKTKDIEFIKEFGCPKLFKSMKARSRYKTTILTGIEEGKIVANDKLNIRQSEVLNALIEELSKKSIDILSLSSKISEVDVIQSLATVSTENLFVKPMIGESLSIKDSYHPLLLLNEADVVTNDICFKDCRTHLITGPNMSGKSTFMRQAAIIIVMHQIGCYIPASSGEVKVYDNILSRVGSNDDMSSGKSTFMVEMMDVANIFKNATANSFVIVDEVGRGTKPEDGEKLAIAITEGLMDIGCDTLISTHYEGLAKLENNGINKMHLSTEISADGSIIFSHKLAYGYSSNSYAFEIAKLAGIPDHILRKVK